MGAVLVEHLVAQHKPTLLPLAVVQLVKIAHLAQCQPHLQVCAIFFDGIKELAWIQFELLQKEDYLWGPPQLRVSQDLVEPSL